MEGHAYERMRKDPPPEPPSAEAVATVRALSAMLAVGMRDTALLPQHVIAAFRLSYPEAPVVELRNSGHFPTEDDPEALLVLLELFVHMSRMIVRSLTLYAASRRARRP